MGIVKLWNDHLSIEWWKMLLIGMFFLLANTGIFFAMWYVRRGVALECGYPQRRKKAMKEKLAAYSMLDHIFLVRLTAEADQKGPMLYINLICHFLNLAAFGATICGFVGCMISLADGWAMTLLTMSELGALFITVSLEFIPHLIWLPSERKRYRRK